MFVTFVNKSSWSNLLDWISTINDWNPHPFIFWRHRIQSSFYFNVRDESHYADFNAVDWWHRSDRILRYAMPLQSASVCRAAHDLCSLRTPDTPLLEKNLSTSLYWVASSRSASFRKRYKMANERALVDFSSERTPLPPARLCLNVKRRIQLSWVQWKEHSSVVSCTANLKSGNILKWLL